MSDYDLTALHLPLNHPQNVERRLRERIAGLLDQHHRDSAELRELCAARDEARRERDALQARIDGAAVGYYDTDEEWEPDDETRVAVHFRGKERPKVREIHGKFVALVTLD